MTACKPSRCRYLRADRVHNNIIDPIGVVNGVHSVQSVATAVFSDSAGIRVFTSVEVENRILLLIFLDICNTYSGSTFKTAGINAVLVYPRSASA